MMKQVTGFHNNCCNKVKEPKKQCDLLATFIQSNYRPIGISENKVFKSSDELIYEFSQVVSVDVEELTKALTDAGYRTEFIHSEPYWILYERN